MPGLVLAAHWPTSRWVLLDAGLRRTDFLVQAVDELGWQERVVVVRARAEEAGRDPRYRGSCDLVTARSFGSPAATAECAAAFLRVGGRLIVSEPPESSPRWVRTELAGLGLTPLRRVRAMATYQVLEQRGPCPDRYPRRVGLPAKRPLFG